VTTEVGHFNGFPLDPKAAVPNHKSRDFVAIVDGIRAKGAKVVILNHPRWPSYEDSPFTNEQLDHATGTFASGMQLTVDATELINATTEQTDPLRLFSDWFSLLSRGLRIFAVGSSDSHTVGDPVGQGRTYFVSDSDDPSNIDIDKACAAIKQGHSSVGMGIFASVVVDGSARMGDTLVLAAPADGRVASVQVAVRVQAPSWILPRKLAVFVNGIRVIEQEVGAMPGIATDKLLSLTLECPDSYDRWIVCVVTGDSAQGPFWPSLNPYSLAATNPVFLDCDGDGWISPRATAEREFKAAAGSVHALGSAFERVDETIAVHLLDVYAQSLQALGSSPEELRRLVHKLVSRTNPAYKQLRSFADRF
jgi:hypothetical protein